MVSETHWLKLGDCRVFPEVSPRLTRGGPGDSVLLLGNGRLRDQVVTRDRQTGC